MILGLPALVLLVGPANDSSQRSIKSSAEILGDTSAFRSHSARGSRDYKRESHRRSDGEGENCSAGFQRIYEYNLNNGNGISNLCKRDRKNSFKFDIVSLKRGNKLLHVICKPNLLCINSLNPRPPQGVFSLRPCFLLQIFGNSPVMTRS